MFSHPKKWVKASEKAANAATAAGRNYEWLLEQWPVDPGYLLLGDERSPFLFVSAFIIVDDFQEVLVTEGHGNMPLQGSLEAIRILECHRGFEL